MRADLELTPKDLAWYKKHGVRPPTERRMLNRASRRLLNTALAPVRAVPPGPHGFDVSSYQPAAPNFRVGGRAFAIFKATESVTYFDPHFNANRQAAHAQGCVAIGIYHFARPGSTSPDAQAQWFLSHVGARQSGEFAVLDYEVGPWSEPWIVRYVQVLQAAGWHVAFYTYAGMAASNSTSQTRQATPFYWPAGYSSNPPSADRWVDIGWTLWQHTDGAVGSVDGPWDCSVANAGLLSQLAQAGVSPTPPPPPSPQEDDDMSTLAIGSIQVGAVEPIALPPPHGGGANWGDVWLSFAVDFNPQLIRIAIGNPDKWDLIQDNVIVPVGRRLGFRCVTGAEVASVIHRGASSGKPEEALPISYLLEVTKGP